jgi:hypothetical protein
MSRDLMHAAEIKDLVREAYRHVPPTTAAVEHNLYSDEEQTRRGDGRVGPIRGAGRPAARDPHPAGGVGLAAGAGALTENGFLHKLQRAGLTGAQVLHRQPLSIDDCALYPLFSDDVIALMRKLIPTERRGPGGGGPCGEVTPAPMQ